VYRGVPVEIVRDTVSMLKGLKTPVPRTISTLPVKFSTVELAKARAGLGLSEEVFLEAQARCRLSHGESSLLLVRRLAAGGKASKGLMTGDVVLSVDKQLVLRPFEVEEACRGKKCVTMRVLRNHAETSVNVTVDELDTLGTSRVILWSGLFLQEPHLPALLMGYVPEEGGGVYISRWSYGSPAQKYATLSHLHTI
jgi:S1-C subfamily serine protease